MPFDPVEAGHQHWASGLLCAESVLLALSEELGLESEYFPRIATGLCAGVGRTSNQCGALSGAIMGLGLALGRDHGKESLEPCFRAVRELVESFTERYGTINCAELIGCDLLTEEGQKYYLENDLWGKCDDLIKGAIELARPLLKTPAEKKGA